MASFQALYNTLFKRSSTFAVLIVGSAFFTDRAIDGTADFIFNRLNEGKLWEHIKPEQ